MELSIVILLIGLLVAGVTQGSRLVKQYKLKNAQTLTQSSPVHSTQNLVLWLEPTMNGSLTSVTNDDQPEDGDAISSWNDINPQSTKRINLSQASANNRPSYKLEGINGLPSVNFDGAASPNQDYLSNTTLVPIDAGDDSYTMIVVWKANNVQEQILFSQGSNVVNRMGSVFAHSTGNYGFAAVSNDYFVPYSAATPYISVVRLDTSLANNVSVFTNSNTASSGVTDADGPAALDIMTNEVSIGARVTDHIQWLNGLISEVIIFDRYLRQSEIEYINAYLAKKYAITVN